MMRRSVLAGMMLGVALAGGSGLALEVPEGAPERVDSRFAEPGFVEPEIHWDLAPSPRSPQVIRPGAVPVIAKEMLGGAPRSDRAFVSQQLWNELEARGIDVERFLDRLNDPGRDGEELRQRLITRGMVVSQLRHELNTIRAQRQGIEALQNRHPEAMREAMRERAATEATVKGEDNRAAGLALERVQRIREKHDAGLHAGQVRDSLREAGLTRDQIFERAEPHPAARSEIAKERLSRLREANPRR